MFDLAAEPDETRNRYGRTEIGQSLLAARRLVEYGVPYVAVNHSGWDSHKRHFETMKKRSDETDAAVAAFLTDLKAKGLRMCARGAKIAKRKAVTAVARSLAVLMVAMLKKPDAPYVPLSERCEKELLAMRAMA